MPFTYKRMVQFRDTDAAGVVYFANVLSMCHEAYEASLQAAGIELRQFFGDRHHAIPIVHAEVDLFQPMFCGEIYRISLIPQLLKPSEFLITYHLSAAIGELEPDIAEEKGKTGAIARAITCHVCIDPNHRRRQPLNPPMQNWLEQFQALD
ncbi:MAG: thioesterase family protein [Leptolyngbyaceae bacterium]|nr:thioesterase family protein [Leptolyngbyaceae bacterium]